MRNTVKLFGFLALMGLLASCNNQVEGEKVEATETQEVVQDAEAKTLTVDVATAKMEWQGSKVTGKHNGTVNIKSGSLMVKGTELVGGSFVIDMNSINTTDLKGDMKAKLDGHLKTGDFFEADKFPEGKFEITGVKAEAGENGATHKVSGNLTLKDKSFGVEIPATITMENGAATISTPQFVINRQNWGINFTGKKDDLISNDMGIKLNFTAK
jgi:polyisoprenoid-binding protein YceI